MSWVEKAQMAAKLAAEKSTKLAQEFNAENSRFADLDNNLVNDRMQSFIDLDNDFVNDGAANYPIDLTPHVQAFGFPSPF